VIDLIRDEQGNLSTARLAFWLVVPFDLIAVWFDAASVTFNMPPVGYGLLGTLTTIIGAWAAGPRMAQYLLPQLGTIVQNLANGKGDTRLPNVFKDDER
jgi:hypothetical protein